MWMEPEIYQIGTVNRTSQNDWPKETWKKCPIKVSHTAMRMRFSDSLSLSLAVRPSTGTVFFSLNKEFTGFTTFHLCGDSFLKSRRARVHVTDHWSSG